MGELTDAAVAGVLEKLAEFFGTTVEYVTAHAPEFLAKYGWYSVFNDMGEGLFLGILVSGLVWVFAALGAMFLEDCFDVEKFPKWIPILLTIVILAGFIAIPLIQCYIAPDMYGLMQLIEELK